MHRLTDTLAIQMARLAIENIRREYPNAPRRVAEGLGDDPRARAAAAAGETHLDAALPYLFSGEYAGDH